MPTTYDEEQSETTAEPAKKSAQAGQFSGTARRLIVQEDDEEETPACRPDDAWISCCRHKDDSEPEERYWHKYPDELGLTLTEGFRELMLALAWIQIGCRMLAQEELAGSDVVDGVPAASGTTDADAEDIGRLLIFTGAVTIARLLRQWSGPVVRLAWLAVATGLRDIRKLLRRGRLPDGRSIFDDNWWIWAADQPPTAEDYPPAEPGRSPLADALMLWSHVGGEVEKYWNNYNTVPRRERAPQSTALMKLEGTVKSGEHDNIVAYLQDTAENLGEEVRAFEELMNGMKKPAPPAAVPARDAKADAAAFRPADNTITVQLSVGYANEEGISFEFTKGAFANDANKKASVDMVYQKELIGADQGLQSAADGPPQTYGTTVGAVEAREAKLAGQASAVALPGSGPSSSEARPNPLTMPRKPAGHVTYADAAERRWGEETGEFRQIHVEFPGPDMARFQASRLRRGYPPVRTEWMMSVTGKQREELLSLVRQPAQTVPGPRRLSPQTEMLLQPGRQFFEHAPTAAVVATTSKSAAPARVDPNINPGTQQAPASARHAGLIKDINRINTSTTVPPDQVGALTAIPTQGASNVGWLHDAATGFFGGVAAEETAANPRGDNHQVVDGDQLLYLYRLHEGHTLSLGASLASGTQIVVELLGSEPWLPAHLAAQGWNFHGAQIVMEDVGRAAVTYSDYGKDVTCQFYGDAAVIAAVKTLLDNDIASRLRVGRHYHMDGKRKVYRLGQGDAVTPEAYLESGTVIDVAVFGSNAWLALHLPHRFNTGRIEREDPAHDDAMVSYSDVRKGVKIRLMGTIALVRGIKPLVDGDILRKQREVAQDPEENSVNVINEGASWRLPHHPKKGAKYEFEYIGTQAALVLHLTGQSWSFNIGRLEMENRALNRALVSYTDMRNDVRVELSGEIAVTKANKKLLDDAILNKQRQRAAEEKRIEAVLPLRIPRSDGRTFLQEFYQQVEQSYRGADAYVPDTVRRIVDTRLTGDDSRTFYHALVEELGHPVTHFVLIDHLTPLALARENALDDVKTRIQRLGGGRFDVNEKTMITCHYRLKNVNFEWDDKFHVSIGDALRGKVYRIQDTDMVEGDKLSFAYVWPECRNDPERYEAFKRALMQEKINYPDFGGKKDAVAFPSRIENHIASRQNDVPDNDSDEQTDAEGDDYDDDNGETDSKDLITQTIGKAGGTAPGLSFVKSTPLAYRIEIFDAAYEKQSTSYHQTTLASALKGKVFRQVEDMLDGKIGYRARIAYAVTGFDHESKKYHHFASQFFSSKIVKSDLSGTKEDFAFPFLVKNIRGRARVYEAFDEAFSERRAPFYPYWRRILKTPEDIKEIQDSNIGPAMALEFAQKRLIQYQTDLAKALERSHTEEEIRQLRETVEGAKTALEGVEELVAENGQQVDEANEKRKEWERKDAFYFSRKLLPLQEMWMEVGSFASDEALAPEDTLVLDVLYRDGTSSLQPVLIPEDFRTPSEWPMVAANLTNTLDELAAGIAYSDGWIVPGNPDADGETPSAGDDAKVYFRAPRKAEIKSVSLIRDKQDSYKRPLKDLTSTIYSKPLADGEAWKLIGSFPVDKALLSDENIVVKIKNTKWGGTDHVEIDVPKEFRGAKNWGLYVANEINRRTEYAAGERKTPGGMITPDPAAKTVAVFGPANFVGTVSLIAADAKVDAYLSGLVTDSNLVADLRGDAVVEVTFGEEHSTYTSTMSLYECLRGGIHNFIKKQGIGADGGDVQINYYWPWTSGTNEMNLQSIVGKIRESRIVGNADDFAIPWAFPDEMKNHEIIKSSKTTPTVPESRTVVTITDPEQCRRKVEELSDELIKDQAPYDDLILRSPHAFLAEAGEKIFRKHKMPVKFNPDEKVSVLYKSWSDSSTALLTDYFNIHRGHANFYIEGKVPGQSYGNATVSQGVLISGNLRKKIKLNTYRLASGSDKLPNAVFQDLISADPSVEYRKLTTAFYSNREYRVISGKGYKHEALKIIRQHVKAIDGYDPEQRLLKGKAKMHPVEFSSGTKTVRLGKTLMYSDEEKGIYFLVMPDSGVSRAIVSPNEAFTLRGGSNWSILADMLDSTRDPTLIKLILAHFKDRDFEDPAFIAAFGAGYVQAVKEARTNILKADYVQVGSLTGRRLSEITIEAQMDRYLDDLIIRLNDIMDDITMSQLELKNAILRHILLFSGGLIATGLSVISIAAGGVGAGFAATAFGATGLAASIATTTGAWLSEDFNKKNPVQAEIVFRAWLTKVVTDMLFFVGGMVPVANLVFTSANGALMTNVMRSSLAARMINRLWGPAVGVLGLKVGSDIDTYFENAIAEELMKQGMPDPRMTPDACRVDSPAADKV